MHNAFVRHPVVRICTCCSIEWDVVKEEGGRTEVNEGREGAREGVDGSLKMRMADTVESASSSS